MTTKVKIPCKDFWFIKTVILIIFIILTLCILDGKHYVECKHIFLDEIMDFPCCFSLNINQKLQTTFNDLLNTFCLFEKGIELVSILETPNILTSQETSFNQQQRERLFLLKHYIS